MQEKLILLQELYDNSSWLDKKIFSCRKGCATCCTQSVTMSSLEGEFVYTYLERVGELQKITQLLGGMEKNLFRPGMTTNQLARHCLEQRDIPDEKGDWSFEVCPFLENGICGIYEVRPFGCRALVSVSQCSAEGAAFMPPVLITLNTLMHQIIEHLSVGGCWGNMLDVLPQIFKQRGLVKSKGFSEKSVLCAPEAMPGFLVSEKERPAVRKYLEGIGNVLQKHTEGEIQGEVNELLKCFESYSFTEIKRGEERQ